MTDDRAVAQFPLGTVLFPGQPLPLNIFESRYRAMLADVLASDSRFGVVLIERGNEVGGGDERSDVGTLARIEQHQVGPDGSARVLVVGEQRIRIVRWLEDDPYPQAVIERWPDVDQVVEPGIVAELEALTLEALGLAARAAHQPIDLPSELALDPDPVIASFQVSALAPVSSFDKQRLLRADGPAVRLDRARTALSEVMAALRFSLD